MLNTNKIPTNSNRVKQPLLEPAMYPGRPVQVITLGLQPQRPFKGVEKDPAQTIRVIYELSDEFIVDEDGKLVEDKPRWVAEEFPIYSIEADKAKSTKRIMAMDPEKVHGDFSKVLGVPVLIKVTVGKPQDDGTQNNYVGDVSPMRAKDAEKLPELKNPTTLFDMSSEETWPSFWTLPDWLRERITSALDFGGSPFENFVAMGAPSSDDEKTPDSKGAVDEGDEESW